MFGYRPGAPIQFRQSTPHIQTANTFQPPLMMGSVISPARMSVNPMTPGPARPLSVYKPHLPTGPWNTSSVKGISPSIKKAEAKPVRPQSAVKPAPVASKGKISPVKPGQVIPQTNPSERLKSSASQAPEHSSEYSTRMVKMIKENQELKGQIQKLEEESRTTQENVQRLKELIEYMQNKQNREDNFYDAEDVEEDDQ